MENFTNFNTNHCFHDTGGTFPALVPHRDAICCFCGESARDIPTLDFEEMRGHGKFMTPIFEYGNFTKSGPCSVLLDLKRQSEEFAQKNLPKVVIN